jgi:outer membrane protein TolC
MEDRLLTLTNLYPQEFDLFFQDQTLSLGIRLDSNSKIFKLSYETSDSEYESLLNLLSLKDQSVDILLESTKIQNEILKTKNLRENQLLLEAGLLEEYDVLRIEVQLANQEPQLDEARLSVEESYRNLKEVMGLPLDFEMEIEGNLNNYDVNNPGETAGENQAILRIDQATPLPQVTKENALSVMRQKRGDLRALQVQDDLKDREILAIKSRFLPTITADYNLQWTSAQAGVPRPFENSVRFQTLMFNFSLPLFTGFERMANLNIAQIEKKDIQVQKWALEKSSINEFETSANRIYNLRETAAARKRAVEQAKRGYEIATKRLSNGVGSQLDVTEAELQVREAELNYATMVFEYLNAKADFDLAVGMVPMIDETEFEF